MADVVIIGSINIDLVIQVPRFPDPGETITGGDLQLFPGGKGANQAVAVAKHQVSTAMIGKIGDDPYGEILHNSLNKHQVDTSSIQIQKDAATGSALISITPQGENMILLSPGANAHLLAEDLLLAEELIKNASIILLQLEIPLPTVVEAVRLGKKHRSTIILNPAPAAELPLSMLKDIDILVPNQTELALLSGRNIGNIPSAEKAAKELVQSGIPTLIVTMGSEGALLVDNQSVKHIPAIEIEAVDTTAAGDSFIGGLAAALIKGKPLADAIFYANISGALAATKPGAQPSLPSASEVEQMLLSLVKQS